MVNFKSYVKHFPKTTLFWKNPIRTNYTEILPFKRLPYNSVELDVAKLPVNDTSEFSTRLWSTIASLRNSDVKAVYLKISILYAHYAPVASMLGFRYHHAEDENATMLLWLPQSDCEVPPYATHHCGVAGAVIKDNKLLVVKETNKLTAGWKLPGGYVNRGEEYSDAVVREVYEETNVKASFSSILTVRHQHNIQFGCSDIYIICKLNPITTEISINHEIETATWMDLNDFKAVNKQPMLDVAIELLKSEYTGLQESIMPSTVPGRKPYRLYHPKNFTSGDSGV